MVLKWVGLTWTIEGRDAGNVLVGKVQVEMLFCLSESFIVFSSRFLIPEI
jgi:hypothetical protein